MSVQTLRPTQEPSRLGLAFLTALLLHAGALAAVTLWPRSADDPPGEQEITIDLAPAMEEMAAVTPDAAAAPEIPPVEAEALPVESETLEAQTPEEVVEVRPEEPVEVQEPEQVTDAAPVEALPAEPAATETETAVLLPPPDAVVARPLEAPPPPKTERKPTPPKPMERKPPPRRAIAQPQPPSEARQGQISASRENTGGAAASADPNIRIQYFARLRAALQSRLRFPSTMQNQGIGGVVRIRFTLDDSGRIVSSSLASSSGHPALDEAALATARPGSSVPAAPSSVSERSYTIPLRFNAR